MKKQQIIRVLPKDLQSCLSVQDIHWDRVQEIRLRVGQVVRILCDNQEDNYMKNIKITPLHIKEILEYVSNYSIYAYEEEIRQGYITIEGGHRVGLVGKVIMEQGMIKNLKYISAINLRVSHEITGCARKYMAYICKEKKVLNSLIISPPGGGKTTLLRDFIRLCSKGTSYNNSCNVGVVDERSELAGTYQGVAQNDLGPRTDVLDACPKSEGILMLIRSMAPDVIGVDEIGSTKDIEALTYGLHCGCSFLATIHGNDLEEVLRKREVTSFIKEGGFQRFIVLGKKVGVDQELRIYNENLEQIF